MKALILTCNTGEGHNSTANAIKDVFDAHGVVCDSADTIGFLSRLVSAVVCHAHARIYRHMPRAFGAGYRAAEQNPQAFERKTPLYRLLTRGTKKLYQFVLAGGYDTIICTHVFSAVLATGLRERYPELALHYAFVATDYTCSPSVKESDMDVFFIPDDTLADDFVAKGVCRERIVGAGLPVRGRFLKRLPRHEAAALCGIDGNRKHLLMMCGSMGCGPMEKLTTLLADRLPENVLLTVICGTNEDLRRRLSRRFAQHPSINVLGFVKNVAELMDCADLYLTKPGGISVTEACAKGLPMVLVNAVAGCEQYNLQYCLDNGLARTANDPVELCELCVSLISDEKALADMREQITCRAHTDAAERIFADLAKRSNSNIGEASVS